MVNTDMVNAQSRHFPPPHFCESFLAFGRIPRFENPVKYTRIFAINRGAPPAGLLLKRIFTNDFNVGERPSGA